MRNKGIDKVDWISLCKNREEKSAYKKKMWKRERGAISEKAEFLSIYRLKTDERYIFNSLPPGHHMTHISKLLYKAYTHAHTREIQSRRIFHFHKYSFSQNYDKQELSFYFKNRGRDFSLKNISFSFNHCIQTASKKKKSCLYFIYVLRVIKIKSNKKNLIRGKKLLYGLKFTQALCAQLSRHSRVNPDFPDTPTLVNTECYWDKIINFLTHCE